MKRRSYLPWSLGLVAIAALAVWFFAFRGKAEQVTYRTEAIDRGDIEVSISATGTLEAVTTVQVGSQVSGTIANLYADFNDKVQEGELLAQLDPTFLQASVGEQQANVDRARAQMNEAQRNYDRTVGLFGRQLVSQADMDAATTSLETAKASMRQSEASLQRAQVNLRYATIKAPISGVVISRDVDVGQTVAASLSAPTLFTIANDLTKMRVEASVDEADIGTVKAGLPVTFRVDAYPDELFQGVVSQVRLKPITSQNVVTYVVIIDVENRNAMLMPGMTATVTIETAKRENVLRVPVSATRFTPIGFEKSQQFARDISTDSAAKGNSATSGETRQYAQNRPSTGDSANVGRSMESRQRFDTTGGQRPHRGEWERRNRQSGDSLGSAGMSMRMRPPTSDSTAAPEVKLQPVTIWLLDQNKQPRPVRALRGLQGSRFVEIVSDEIKEGDQVIVGTSGNGSSGQAVTGQNPFMPRFGGGQRQSGGQRPSGGGGR